MTAQEITAHDIVTFADVKQLASASGPCVTIMVHIPTPFELATRLRNAVRAAEKELRERDVESALTGSLLEPIRDLAATVESSGVWSNALVVFRAPDVFRYFLLHRQVPEVQTVGNRFQVRPLLSALTREQQFHLLCLSRRNVRLLHCTQFRCEETDMRSVVPTDLRIWLNARQPDHVLANRSTAGPSVGQMKGVTFGTATDREREDEYLAHFFKEVDNGVNTLLRGDQARLLLAGVEFELATYRRVTTYPRLFERDVHGSPDGLTGSELLHRAMEVVLQTRSEPLEKALDDFERRGDRGRVALDAREIVKAAWEGRIEDLFLTEDAEFRGAWDAARYDVDTKTPVEDLLNAAALQTALHGGRAFAVEAHEMPAGHDIAAVLRF
jgi:hypothetical protein